MLKVWQTSGASTMNMSNYWDFSGTHSTGACLIGGLISGVLSRHGCRERERDDVLRSTGSHTEDILEGPPKMIVVSGGKTKVIILFGAPSRKEIPD